jgi:hypothetical protein
VVLVDPKTEIEAISEASLGRCRKVRALKVCHSVVRSLYGHAVLSYSVACYRVFMVKLVSSIRPTDTAISHIVIIQCSNVDQHKSEVQSKNVVTS